MKKDYSTWASEIHLLLSLVPDAQLEQAAKVINSSSLVITAGNGGSAYLAAHAAQAVAKPDISDKFARPAVCLTEQYGALTAYSNDLGWENALRNAAMPFLDHQSNVCVVLFSSSGKSTNIVRLAEEVVSRKIPLIAFTGFDGGPLWRLATYSIHVASTDYEVIEPTHEALLHRVQYHIRQTANSCRLPQSTTEKADS